MGKKVSLVLLLSLLVFSLSVSVIAQETDSLYVSATGHWIWGEFLDGYQSVSNPLLYFGNPITDDFIDPAAKIHVQFFEKARFDLIETSEGPQVRLAQLGQLLHESGTPLADIPNEGPSCRAFSSGYSICYAFLQFYDSYDGENRFGMPISDVEVIDDRYMQYFEYARMEWWPDLPAGQRVQLSDLGQIYFDKFIADPELLKPSPPPESSGSQLSPRVNVFTARALIGAGEQQSVYVIVQDMYTRPVEAAQVEVDLLYPNGTFARYNLPITDEYGVSQFTFTAPDLPEQSIVYIRAEIHIRGESAVGKSWFRIWW